MPRQFSSDSLCRTFASPWLFLGEPLHFFLHGLDEPEWFAGETPTLHSFASSLLTAKR